MLLREEGEGDDELNEIMDRLEEEGEAVFQHNYEGSGGLWGLVVASLDGEFWAYDSGDREPSGPFPDLRSALEENSTGHPFLEIGPSSESVSSDLSTEELLDLLDVSGLESGDWLYVNDETFIAVVELVTGPVTRNEILVYLPTPSQPGPKPTGPRHNYTDYMVWGMKGNDFKRQTALLEAVRTCPLSELEDIVMSRPDLGVLCERMSEHGLSESALPVQRVALVRGEAPEEPLVLEDGDDDGEDQFQYEDD